MAIRVYKVAVVGCPRAILSADGYIDGVGKSCLCNRFIRSEAYCEDHQKDWSLLSLDEWDANPVFNGDHFIYWGAATRHLPDRTRVRFQVVEQSELYCSPYAGSSSTSEESESEGEEDSQAVKRRYDTRLKAHLSQIDYISRASSTHFRSQKAGKMAYRLKAMEEAVRMSSGPVRAATQLFPNEEFGGKKSMGIYGFICVFDPTLEGEYMQRQLSFLSELLVTLMKTKRKVVVACVKCDTVEDHAIRFGSNLSSYALKKNVPFFEVSARDSVNIDDVFFSLISAPKKNKNSGRGGSGTLSYREVIDSRKGDINRAKDGFRKFLQLHVNDFSSSWSSTLPSMKMDCSYQSVKQLAGREADSVLLKLFQLRLIEIKLKEAGNQFGNSLIKKADKEKSKQYQVYLKEAFSQHPDLSEDSIYREYLPSTSDETDSILTEPSTPSSCPTPELTEMNIRVTRLRSATLSDLPEVENTTDYQQLNRSIDMLNTLPSTTSSSSNKKGKWKKHFSFATASVEQTPPPLPSRATGSDALASGMKRFSSSTDCLFSPEESNAAAARLDAEPYLQPREVKIVLQHSSDQKQPEPIKDNQRNTTAFLSMRSPKRTKQLRAVVSKDTFLSGKDDKPTNTNSLERRSHKRSQSNPFFLEGMKLDMPPAPPELPPRNLDISGTPNSTHTTPNHGSVKQDGTLELLESSLEFAPPTSADAVWRIGDKPDMPLPPLPDEADSPEATRIRLLSSKSLKDEDNISQTSGPFEEIESNENSRISVTPVVGVERGAGLLRSATLGRGGSGSAIAASSDSEDQDDDQYAEIEELQQYMQMASVTVDKAKTFPAIRSSAHPHEEESDGTLGKRQHRTSSAMSVSPQVPRAATMKREPSAISTLRKKLKKSPRTEQSMEKDMPPPLPHHAGSSAATKKPSQPILDNRPLPPSPTKGSGVSRKISSGSNIYEVIDEEFIHRVRNRPDRQHSRREALADWLPPVDRSLLPKYMAVVRNFFSMPQIQEQWYETVKSVMKDVDSSEVLPPYSKLCSEARFSRLVAEEEDIKEEDELAEERDVIAPLKTKIAKQKPHPLVPPTTTKEPAPPAPPSVKSVGKKTSPALEKLLRVAGHSKSPQVPLAAGHSTTTEASPPTSEDNSLKASAGSDDLILMLNQNQYESDYTSETDSDEEDDVLDSDSSELEFELPFLRNQASPELLLEKRTRGAREALLSQTSPDLIEDSQILEKARSPVPNHTSPNLLDKETEKAKERAPSPLVSSSDFRMNVAANENARSSLLSLSPELHMKVATDESASSLPLSSSPDLRRITNEIASSPPLSSSPKLRMKVATNESASSLPLSSSPDLRRITNEIASSPPLSSSPRLRMKVATNESASSLPLSSSPDLRKVTNEIASSPPLTSYPELRIKVATNEIVSSLPLSSSPDLRKITNEIASSPPLSSSPELRIKVATNEIASSLPLSSSPNLCRTTNEIASSPSLSSSPDLRIIYERNPSPLGSSPDLHMMLTTNEIGSSPSSPDLCMKLTREPSPHGSSPDLALELTTAPSRLPDHMLPVAEQAPTTDKSEPPPHLEQTSTDNEKIPSYPMGHDVQTRSIAKKYLLNQASPEDENSSPLLSDLPPDNRNQPAKDSPFFSRSSPSLPVPRTSKESIPSSPEHAKEKRRRPPTVKPKPRRVSIPLMQTDLDAALELRASVSNDSDLTSTDSALAKSPHSNYSNAEFDLGGSESEGHSTRLGGSESEGHSARLGGSESEGHSTRLGSSETEGVEFVPNVKPSQFLKKRVRGRYRQRSKGEREGSVSEDARSHTDSGTFEEMAPTAD